MGEPTPTETDHIWREDTEVPAYQTALKYLGTRPRSIGELRQRLQRDQWDTLVIDRVLLRLEEQRLVDDAQFARVWVMGRTGSRPKGARALTQELKVKGVEKETIASFMPTPDEELENALRALAPCLRKLEGKEPRLRHQKALDYLLRRGFAYTTAREAFNLAETTDQDP